MAAEGGSGGSTPTNSLPPPGTGGYSTEIFSSGFDHKFICSHCKRILRDPLQSYCGHRFCRVCCQELLGEGQTVPCEECQEDQITDTEFSMLSQDQMFPDNAVKREMARMPTKCSYPFCTWTGIFRDYESQHEKNCPHCPQPCPACGMGVSRVLLEQHQNQECPQRKIRCDHCLGEISAGARELHAAECQQYPLRCEACDKNGIPRYKMKDHKERECPKRSIHCPMGCTEQLTMDTFHQHLTMGLGEHTAWLMDQVLQLEQRLLALPVATASTSSLDSIVTAINGLEQKTTELSRQIEELSQGDLLRQQVTDTVDRVNMMDQVMPVLHHEIEQLLRSLEQMESRAHADRLRAQQLTSQVDQLTSQVRALERTIAIKDATIAEHEVRMQALEFARFDGTLLWKISDFDRKRRDAISGKVTSIYSPAFYTGVVGYKMCARIYPNGDGMGKGTHLSLFFVLMRGHYDSLLPWPFQQKVTLMLIDQKYREHVVDAFRPDPTSSSFKRPTTEMNIASGCPVFLPLSKLVNPQFGYLKDNTMFIKIFVETDGLDKYTDFNPLKGPLPSAAPPQ
ncbi:hypothetical protein C0Q70_18362 [Pomacea canaliculata]|uniref:TNF receptor-associated factor n=1 Tax=Pomacea canaliculata TaxID=400727 RepID=A0A2T7NN15_POMCA|nr:TNF receptor-associated factor 2-like [Pomacea canaliculata]PVD22546.1 hypothetical protein C0Q70_18362 [Pomacea canaliculata]